ncbi:linear amide C-N hydrolase [Nitratireductor kimnyeongensis]|uniref:Linear amide C-N hydrolase n=1 Tax=Nitratireductor kimnyeongensis TaxID=430679 RepID=A0ABW0TBN0_9HYPH|nr:linear amide C-N hydrolase [Nitratireductor kimnyeongensis]QZZ36945.1 linear amide C-N hydrolase [Nitratireductor kimnyeongensis]
MCTSLAYHDASENVYFGRTLELTSDLPYQIVYFPKDIPFSSDSDGHPTLKYTGKNGFIAVTMPGRMPTKEAPLGYKDLKPLEGMNEKGLTFSLLSYPAAGGKHEAVAATKAVLSASDLGSWALSQFATVAEVKDALEAQPVLLEPLALLGGVESPFHYVVHDSTGDCLVIEFNQGEMKLHDNPVGVMTNGPEFSWHLTNLDNYTFLSNVDKSSATFGNYKAVQPDSGIATAGLPASNTSVGRFVRAAYYAQFTEKAKTPDMAVKTLAHVMNNFDRPRGITIDYPSEDGGHLEVAGLSSAANEDYATEFTCWTNLSDLARRRFYLRTYRSLNYTYIDVGALTGSTDLLILPIEKLDELPLEGTGALQQAKAG